MQRDPALPPEPEGGWSTAVRHFENAIVLPPNGDGPPYRCGVLNSGGGYVPRGATWRREVNITLPPDVPSGPMDHLSGRWLWGGLLFNHFGHFLTESTARLWALRDRHDGILFVPRSPQHPPPKTFQTDLLKLLIGDRAIRMIQRPTQVQNLDVAGQGSGLGRIAEGTKAYRDFVARSFAHEIQPEGPKKLFISRSGMNENSGGFVGETVLDDRMAAAGYIVFHPERHDIATQIARYKAAKRIIGFDGSALHLLAMVARPEQRIAIILRRKPGKSSALRRQIAAFTGRAATMINALDPARSGMMIGKKLSIRELDLIAIGTGLKKNGFLPDAAEWGGLSVNEDASIDQLLQSLDR
ncbi:MAG: glycosyltransferase family 61 protein [Thalassovita sp.]